MVREKIRASVIIDRLHKHVIGNLGMDATQVQAARILLDKVVPNLAATDLNVSGELLTGRMVINFSNGKQEVIGG